MVPTQRRIKPRHPRRTSLNENLTCALCLIGLGATVRLVGRSQRDAHAQVVTPKNPASPEDSAADVAYRIHEASGWSPAGHSLTVANRVGDTSVDRCVISGFVADQGTVTSPDGLRPLPALAEHQFAVSEAVGVLADGGVLVKPADGDPAVLGGSGGLPSGALRGARAVAVTLDGSQVAVLTGDRMQILDIKG